MTLLLNEYEALMCENHHCLCMRFGQYIHILVLIAVATCCVQPVCAADEATTYYNTGEAYLATGDYERAIASFDMALASDTTMIKISETLLYTYRDKSYAQIQLQRYDDAVSTTGQGLSLYPRDKMLWNNKGYAYYNLRKYQEALRAYNTAIQYEPDYTIALINKGDTLAKMQDFRGAVEAYTRALETDPGNTDAATRLSDAKQAAVPAPALSEENDTRAVQFYNEGVVFARSGQYAEAIAAYDKAIAINPNVTGAHQDRVIALEKLRQAQQTSATPVQQQNATTPLPKQTQQPTRSAPLSCAPAGAIILMAGIALWSRR
jgi:tetratricopeptide (TPR) repeat protein